VDSTTVRAHQHAAGARIAPPAPVPKGRRQRTDGRSSPAELVRPPGGGGAGAEGLGRSRGGFTAKIHLSADGRCRPLSLLITEGQRAGCTQFEAVLGKIRVPRPVGRPRRKPGCVAADKAYSNSLIRRYLRRRGIAHTIPEKSDFQAARRRKGSRGGRPPGFDAERYKKRNTVERAINKLKQFRVVATRYDKRCYIYLGTPCASKTSASRPAFTQTEIPCPCTTTLNGAFSGSARVATVNTSPGRIQWSGAQGSTHKHNRESVSLLTSAQGPGVFSGCLMIMGCRGARGR